MCLDRADPVPFPLIKLIIAEDLGRPISEVFSSIDERPLASASIAQVHAAVLAGSGKEVVVKVVKPGTADIITADLNAGEVTIPNRLQPATSLNQPANQPTAQPTAQPPAVYLATRLLEFVQPELQRLSLTPILNQLRSSMKEETNLLVEAQHLQHFADFLDKKGLRSVATCPFMYRQFSGKR